MMIFVQPRILPDGPAHFLEQARVGDTTTTFDITAGFEGMPETPVPRAMPAGERPNDLLPPAGEAASRSATQSTPEPTKARKKGLLDKWFKRDEPQ